MLKETLKATMIRDINFYMKVFDLSKNAEKEKDDNPADVPSYSLMAWLLELTSQNDGNYFVIAEKLGYNSDVDEDFLVEHMQKSGLMDKVADDKSRSHLNQSRKKKYNILEKLDLYSHLYLFQ